MLRLPVRRPAPSAFECLESRIALDGAGLTGQYFHNADFTGLAVERTEAVAFSWGTAAPAPGMDGNSFTVRWTGQVEAEFTEAYAFQTQSDEAVRLWVDGQLLIDNWTPHGVTTNSATINLVAGQRYDIRVDYLDNTGSATMHLRWQSASQPLEAIPASQLYASPAGLRGEYTDAFGGAANRIDPNLHFFWGTTRPISGVAVDNFQARWTGMLRPDYSEFYTFTTLSDEGVRVWVGDELIIDHWDAHAASHAVSGDKFLEAGKLYDLRVEYFDMSGSARVELGWSGMSQTGGQVEVIGAEHLFAAHDAPLLVTNPLGQGQDPFVIRWQNSYLHVRSAGGGVWIDQAPQLQDVHSSTTASSSLKVWTAPSGTMYSSQIWAPELHQINGKWYIYVAASDGDNADSPPRPTAGPSTAPCSSGRTNCTLFGPVGTASRTGNKTFTSPRCPIPGPSPAIACSSRPQRPVGNDTAYRSTRGRRSSFMTASCTSFIPAAATGLSSMLWAD
jgi:hypothetical protein